jgi:glycosyltransferase involved in cell wall biosynthesis
MSATKHKIIFVMSSMDNGGAERALLNLMEELPRERYSVNLLLLNPSGLFMNQIPDYVNLLETPRAIADCFSSARQKRPSVRHAIADLFSIIHSRDPETRRGYRWKHFYSHWIEEIPGNFDTAISFINGQVLYFVDEKIQARRKIVFYHGDYKSAHYSKEYEEPHLQHMDGIYGVSEGVVSMLEDIFPELSDRMSVLPNITSPATIQRRACEFEPQEYDETAPRILTVARLTPEKGVDIAVKAAAELKRRGVSFIWFEIGKAPTSDVKAIEKIISELEVGDCFKLLGAKSNPYPYIAHCDIVVQPSRHEGKSVVLDEAKILGRPIVVTSYPTARDQIHDGEGIIVDIDPIALADGIEGLIESPERRKALSERVGELTYDNKALISLYCSKIDGDN